MLRLCDTETDTATFKGRVVSWNSEENILNLIDDIQENTKNSVSEKWVYTHLKSENNEKLPRKDMLDILSVYVGKKSWNDFTHTQRISSG